MKNDFVLQRSNLQFTYFAQRKTLEQENTKYSENTVKVHNTSTHSCTKITTS